MVPYITWKSLQREYSYIIREDGQLMYLGYKTSVLYYNSSLPSWVGDCWKVKLGNENKQLTKTFKTGVLGMVWQEGLKEHGHQRVSSNVSVSRFVRACKKYCTSLLFNPQIINYLSVQFVKKSRCSQCWLLRCTWWQVPHWSRTVTGDQSYIMISSYSINMTIIVRFRSLDMRQVKQVKLTTCSEGEFTCNDGQCITMEQRQVCKEYF